MDCRCDYCNSLVDGYEELSPRLDMKVCQCCAEVIDEEFYEET